MRRRWRWWLAGAALGAALMFAWTWPAQDRSVAGEPAAALRPSLLSSLLEPAPAQQPAPRPEAMLPVPAHGADEVQLCGGAWFKLQADGTPDRDDLMRAARLPEARQQTIAALRAHPDALSRATGLWLEMMQSSDRKAASLTAAAGCDTADCPIPPQLAPNVDPEVAGWRNSLARMALSSNDPRVYVLALHACAGGLREAGACQLLSVAQWARLDPDNAAPWFDMLAAATAASDPAAQDEALHHIATARRSDQRVLAMPAAVLAAAPSDEASTQAAVLLVAEAIGFQAAVAVPGYGPVFTLCKGPALLDANRRQTCSAIAETMVERSDTLLERGIGRKIGREVGWPADRFDRIGGEISDYQSHALAAFDLTSAACAPLWRFLDFVRRNARIGETGALREWVAASGKAPADFIRRERATQAQQRQQAASAVRP